MTDEEFKEELVDWLRRAHFADMAFMYGEEYVVRNRVWIDWEFDRRLKRMTVEEWDRAAKLYINVLKAAKEKEGEKDET